MATETLWLLFWIPLAAGATLWRHRQAARVQALARWQGFGNGVG